MHPLSVFRRAALAAAGALLLLTAVPRVAAEPAPPAGPLSLDVVMVRLDGIADGAARLAVLADPALAQAWGNDDDGMVALEALEKHGTVGLFYEATHRFTHVGHDALTLATRAAVTLPARDAAAGMPGVALEFDLRVVAAVADGMPAVTAELQGEARRGADAAASFAASSPFALKGTAHPYAILSLQAGASDASYDVITLLRLRGYAHGDLMSEAAIAAAVQTAAPSDAELDARPEDATPRIIMRWQIESATQNFGYVIYRATAADGDFQPIHRGILGGVGTTAQPHVFRYLDTDVVPGTRYWYKVEEVGLDGTRTMFLNPDTNQVLVLDSTPKPMSLREKRMFEAGPFLKQPVDR